MKFLEKDLEEIIFNSCNYSLQERGLDIQGTLKRQLRIGNYGIADLVSFERIRTPMGVVVHIKVYELKKDTVNISAFMQAIGYVKGIKSFLQKRGINYEVVFSICLIGREINKNSTLVYLPELLVMDDLYTGYGFLTMYDYNYDIDGLVFNEVECYSLTNEGF